MTDTAPRSKRYPLLVHIPLNYYGVPGGEPSESQQKLAAAKLPGVVRDTLAIDAQVAPLRADLYNYEGESYNVATFGVFFTNVNRQELYGYRDQLNEAFAHGGKDGSPIEFVASQRTLDMPVQAEFVEYKVLMEYYREAKKRTEFMAKHKKNKKSTSFTPSASVTAPKSQSQTKSDTPAVDNPLDLF